MRRYKRCFKGRDAVRWLLTNSAASSEEEAVLLGNDLLRAGLLHHIKYRLLFENKDHLYRYCMVHAACCQGASV